MRTQHSLRNTLIGTLGVGLVAGITVAPTAVMAAPTDAAVVINEVIQNNDLIDDAIELLNLGSTPVDLSGWKLADDKNEMTLDIGTIIEPGQFLAITTDDDARADKFGLGKNDEASLRTPDGTIVDRFAWEGHQPTSYGRCADGTGDFIVTVSATPGAPNDCVASAVGNIVINEVESSDPRGGSDWVELFNIGMQPIDVGGLVLADDNPDNSYVIPEGTVVDPGAFTVLDDFGFGLGKADTVTITDGDTVVDTYSWTAHADHTFGRCPVDGLGEFTQTASATPGMANDCVAVETPAIVVNEVETSDGNPGDWIELYNLEDTEVDLSGWVVRDNDDAHVSVLPEGSVIPAGGFFVVEESQLGFGLGKEDSARLYLPGGLTLVDEYSWTAVLDNSHSPTTFGRCVDGTGDWKITTASTKGAPNDCGLPVRINELSSQGNPGDWVELINVGYESADLSGLQLVDSGVNNEPYTFAAGTTLEAGAYLQVFVHETFGLGGTDSVTLLDTEATIIDTVAWNSHVTPSLGRCPDGTGDFSATREATPGAANACEGDLITSAWPGSTTMFAPDQPDFGADMSGVVYANDGTIWAVNNGNGTLHHLDMVDGALVELESWILRYADGLGTVDAEGVALIDGDAANGVLVASERNTGTGDRGSRPSVLLYDVSTPGEILAAQEWNFSGFYPGIGANAGLEGVAWIANADLVAAGLIDENTSAIFDPASYPAHSGGVVFVAVEATSKVAGYVLGDAGEMIRITEFDTAFPGVMELEWDTANGQLWVLCDDACEGRTQVFEVSGPATSAATASNLVVAAAAVPVPGTFVSVAVYERPAGTPNYANEGLAFAPADLCVDGQREVVWANDSNDNGQAFRFGSITCAAVVDPGLTDPEVPTPEVPTPEVPTPEVPTPEVPAPEVPVPGETTPEVPSPEVPVPGETDPELPAPGATDPVENDPVVTDPVVTDPAVTDPVGTDPVVTDGNLASTDGALANTGLGGNALGAIAALSVLLAAAGAGMLLARRKA